MDVLIPDLVELGVTAIHIFGQVDVAKARLNKKVIDRWRRIIEAPSNSVKDRGTYTYNPYQSRILHVIQVRHRLFR